MLRGVASAPVAPTLAGTFVSWLVLRRDNGAGHKTATLSQGHTAWDVKIKVHKLRGEYSFYIFKNLLGQDYPKFLKA